MKFLMVVASVCFMYSSLMAQDKQATCHQSCSMKYSQCVNTCNNDESCVNQCSEAVKTCRETCK